MTCPFEMHANEKKHFGKSGNEIAKNWVDMNFAIYRPFSCERIVI